MRRSGILGALFRFVLYLGIAAVAVGVFYPGLLENPGETANQAKMAAEAVGAAVDAPSPDEIDVNQVERRVHFYVNQRRQAEGLDRLSYDSALADIARQYSSDMARRGFFSHYSPEGEDFSDRYDAAGYDCRVRDGNRVYRGGENLAKSYIGRPVEMHGERTVYRSIDELAEGIVTGWMRSPEHRENMLNPVWEQEGIGVSITDSRAVYVTQNFC